MHSLAYIVIADDERDAREMETKMKDILSRTK